MSLKRKQKQRGKTLRDKARAYLRKNILNWSILSDNERKKLMRAKIEEYKQSFRNITNRSEFKLEAKKYADEYNSQSQKGYIHKIIEKNKKRRERKIVA